MKTTERLLQLAVAVATAMALDLPARGQVQVAVPQSQVSGASQAIHLGAPKPGSAPTNDPAFELTFPGGTVSEFVDAVSRAVGRAVNVILNPDLADTAIPPMKLRGVTVPRLFEAVQAASQRTITLEPPNPAQPGVRYGRGGVQPDRFQYSHGFRTTDAVPSTDSVWVFYREDPPAPLPPAPPARPEAPPSPPAAPVLAEVRVMNLTPILEGRSIDDITTAVRTACDMLEGAPPPKLTFHKETNLLMLRGTPPQLEIMERVLREIAVAPAPSTSAPKPAFQMSPQLMKRYGLMPPTPSAPVVAPRRPPTPEAVPAPESAPKNP